MSKALQKILMWLLKGVGNVRIHVIKDKMKRTYTVEQYFSVVEASKLSLDDGFLKHETQTREEYWFKQMVIEAINSGLSDFKAPCLDPSVDKKGNIYYKPGSNPGVGYSSKWWNENATKIIPERSRQGTTLERIAFLAFLIKKGFATWDQICNHSQEIGHYKDSKYAKNSLERTGSRPCGNFCDLANTFKITENKEISGFSLVGVSFLFGGSIFTLTGVYNECCPNNDARDSVGWIVLDM